MPVETKDGVVKVIVYISVIRDGKILLVDYKTPPNPGKKGWWIPAPDVKYGEHPEERAVKTLDDLAVECPDLQLVDVESFVSGTGWHLIFHYRGQSTVDASTSENITRVGWFGADDLPEANEFAHGSWERKLALKGLGK